MDGTDSMDQKQNQNVIKKIRVNQRYQ